MDAPCVHRAPVPAGALHLVLVEYRRASTMLVPQTTEMRSGNVRGTPSATSPPALQCRPQPLNKRTRRLNFYAFCPRSFILLFIEGCDVSGLIRTVTCLNPRNLLLGHAPGPGDAITTNPVVRPARVVPVAYGGVEAHESTFISQLPFRRRERRHHFLPAPTSTKMRCGLVLFTDIQDPWLEHFRDKFYVSWFDGVQLHGCVSAVVTCLASEVMFTEKSMLCASKSA